MLRAKTPHHRSEKIAPGTQSLDKFAKQRPLKQKTRRTLVAITLWKGPSSKLGNKGTAIAKTLPISSMSSLSSESLCASAAPLKKPAVDSKPIEMEDMKKIANCQY
mmetsp:Transcript_55327/g.104038  ORF Transcript_55327/g.104038 Transcript_55327/m.104038 type:complete len:106 (+) Transcript_55327:157-474(+)